MERKHELIASELEKAVRSGVYRPGDFLPAERVIAEQFSASRPTVRKALAHLVEDGLLANHPGLGTSVRAVRTENNRDDWKVIGLLIPNFENHFFIEVAEAVEYTALQRGYQVLLCNTRHDTGIQEIHLKHLARQRVDGVIFVHDPYTPFPKSSALLKSAGIPYVGLFSSPSTADCDSVLLDDDGGVIEAMRYLFSLGHRHIAFCKAVAGDRMHPREAAYRQFLSDNGLELPPHFLVDSPSGSKSDQRDLMHFVFNTEPAPTAIFAGNDQTALLCMKELAKMGKRIPGDVSVVGFDNLRFTEYLPIPLTTVDQPKREMGRRAVEMLLERIELGLTPEPRMERFHPHLVIRDSCGVAPLRSVTAPPIPELVNA